MASPAKLHECLADPAVRSALDDFARAEHCDEGLTLLRKLLAFASDSASTMTRITLAADVNKLLRSGVVNASAKTRTAVDTAVTALRAWASAHPSADGKPAATDGAAAHLAALLAVFAELQAVTERELAAGVLSRFLASPAYRAASGAAPPGDAVAPAAAGAEAGSRRDGMGASLLRSLGSSVRFRGGGLGIATGGGSAGAASVASPSSRSSMPAAFTFSGAAAGSATSGSPATSSPQPAITLDLTDAHGRREGLLSLLRNPAARGAFLDFCRNQHNEENVELLLDIHAFRALRHNLAGADTAKRKAAAAALLDTYIRTGSPREANIDSRTRVMAELFLSKAAAGTDDPTAEEDVTAGGRSSPLTATAGAGAGAGASETSGGGRPVSGIFSTTASNALGKVETELINMLSGEVLPRFAVSKLWAECAANASPISGARAPIASAAAALGGSTAAAATSGGSGGGTSTASTGAAAGGAFSGLRRMLGVGGSNGSGGAAAAATAATSDGEGGSSGGSAIASLRDKLYVFGVSLKPHLFTSSKKGELESLGADVKATALKSGYIFKRAQHKRSWKRRWWVLTPRCLAYFDSPTATTPSGVTLMSELSGDATTEWDPRFAGRDSHSASPVVKPESGSTDPAPIALAGSTASGSGGATLGEDDGLPPDIADMSFVFYLPTTHRIYTLQGASDKDRARWLFAINAARRGDTDVVQRAETVGYDSAGGGIATGAASRLAAAKGTSLRHLRPPAPLVTPSNVSHRSVGSSGESSPTIRPMAGAAVAPAPGIASAAGSTGSRSGGASPAPAPARPAARPAARRATSADSSTSSSSSSSSSSGHEGSGRPPPVVAAPTSSPAASPAPSPAASIASSVEDEDCAPGPTQPRRPARMTFAASSGSAGGSLPRPSPPAPVPAPPASPRRSAGAAGATVGDGAAGTSAAAEDGGDGGDAEDDKWDATSASTGAHGGRRDTLASAAGSGSGASDDDQW